MFDNYLERQIIFYTYLSVYFPNKENNKMKHVAENKKNKQHELLSLNVHQQLVTKALTIKKR